MKHVQYLNKLTNKEESGILYSNYVVKKNVKTNLFSDYVLTDEKVALEDITLLAPVKPENIIAIGLNYMDHAKELNKAIPTKPVVFFKAKSSLLDPKGLIELPEISNKVDYEAELVVVIKKECKNVKVEDVSEYIAGYTIANDVTARDHQDLNGQWCLCKSCDTFCPLGPCIEDDLNVNNLKISAKLNGKIVQESNTSNLIFKIDYLISYLSSFMTLNANDVILTGTPSGIGKLSSSDTIEIEIENIGTLSNKVK